MFKKEDLLKYERAICQKNYASEGSRACQFSIQNIMSVAEVLTSGTKELYAT